MQPSGCTAQGSKHTPERVAAEYAGEGESGGSAARAQEKVYLVDASQRKRNGSTREGVVRIETTAEEEVGAAQEEGVVGEGLLEVVK